jgi:hypothetical protein
MPQTSYTPKITAKDVAEFQRVEELLKELPQCIIDQIETAEWHSLINSVICNCKRPGKETIIPSTVSKIIADAQGVSVYCKEKYLFKIPLEGINHQLSYNFFNFEIFKEKQQ